MRKVLSWIIALGLLSSTLSTVWAQAPTFGETIDVRVVNVEVVVTDKKGVRIQGLSPDDFELLVDGQEVSVEYFTEVQDGRAMETATSTTATTDLKALPSVPRGEPVGTSYLLFIDDLFSLAVDRNKVLQGLVDEVSFLGPKDRMAVVRWDGKRVEMLSTWSNDWVKLQKVLKKAKEADALGIQELARRNFLRESRRYSRGTGIDRRDMNEDHYIRETISKVHRTVRATAATLRGFASPPGRKTMLILSGGWPYDPVESALEELDSDGFGSGVRQRFSARQQTNQDRFSTLEYDRGDTLFSALTDTANKVGYTLYPIDVPGLRSDNFGADMSSRDRQNVGFGTFSRDQQMNSALRFMASKTGGKALFARDRRASLSVVQSDTRSYYWLGFTPLHIKDDSRHSIKVRLGSKDYDVRFRQDYVDSSRASEATMAVESALLFGGPNDEAAFPVEFGEPKRAGIGKIEVPLSVAIPLDRVTVLPAGGQWMVRLELRIAVIDDSGGRSDVPVIAISLDLDKKPQPEDFGMYRTTLKLRKSKHRIVLALHDVATGEALMTPVNFDPK